MQIGVRRVSAEMRGSVRPMTYGQNNQPPGNLSSDRVTFAGSVPKPKPRLLSTAYDTAMLAATGISEMQGAAQSNAPYMAALLARASEILRNGVPEAEAIKSLQQFKATQGGDLSAVMVVPHVPPTVLTKDFQKALGLAMELHAYQKRKGGGVPYVAHLFSVASIALRYGATEHEAMAALLHDAIEDQGGVPTAAKIGALFHPEVLDIVQGCTETDLEPKPPWRERKDDYIAHIRSASPSVGLVAASDKLDNMQDVLDDHARIGEAVWSKFKVEKADSLWFYQAVLEAFKAAQNAPLLLITALAQTHDRLVKTAHPEAAP